MGDGFAKGEVECGAWLSGGLGVGFWGGWLRGLKGPVLRCPGVGTQAAGLAVGLPGGRVGNSGLFGGFVPKSANQDIITR